MSLTTRTLILSLSLLSWSAFASGPAVPAKVAPFNETVICDAYLEAAPVVVPVDEPSSVVTDPYYDSGSTGAFYNDVESDHNSGF